MYPYSQYYLSSQLSLWINKWYLKDGDEGLGGHVELRGWLPDLLEWIYIG